MVFSGLYLARGRALLSLVIFLSLGICFIGFVKGIGYVIVSGSLAMGSWS